MRSSFHNSLIFIAITMVGWLVALADAQMLSRRPEREDVAMLESPQQWVTAKERALIEDVLEPELMLRVNPTRSKIVRTRMPIGRIAISHPDIVDVNEFDTMEIEIIGKQLGEATLSLWFPQPDGTTEVLRYLVQVVSDNAQDPNAATEHWNQCKTASTSSFPIVRYS